MATGGTKGIRAGRAFVELFADDSKLVRGLKQAQRKLRAWSATATRAGLALFGAGTAAAGSMIGAAKSFATVGDNLEKMSRRTGVSVEALSELGYAADLSGSSLEAVENGIKRMQAFLLQGARGTQEATDALNLMGLSMSDLMGLSPEKQFEAIAGGLASISDPSLRTAAALAVFSRSGTQLLPLMERGAAGMAAMRQEARSLGLTISTEDAQAAAKFNDTMTTMWATVKRGVFAIGAALAPELKALAKYLTGLAVRATEWIKANKGIIVTALKVAAGVAAAGAALLGVAVILKGMAVVAGIVTAVFGVLGAIGTVLAAIGLKVGIVIAVIVAVVAAVLYYTGALGKMIRWLSGLWDKLRADAVLAWGGIVAAVKRGDLGAAFRIVWAGVKLYAAEAWTWLKNKWTDFKVWFLSFASEMWGGFLASFELAMHGIVMGLLKIPEIIKSLPGGTKLYNRFFKDMLDEMRGVEEYSHDKRMKDISDEHAARVKSVKGAAGKERRERQEQIDALRREYEQLIKDANKRLRPGGPYNEAGEDRPAIRGGRGLPKAIAGIQGTFSAIEASRAYAGASFQARTAKATEDIRDILKDIQANGGAAFD